MKFVLLLVVIQFLLSPISAYSGDNVGSDLMAPEGRLIVYSPHYNRSILDYFMYFLGKMMRTKEVFASNLVDLRQKLVCLDCNEGISKGTNSTPSNNFATTSSKSPSFSNTTTLPTGDNPTFNNNSSEKINSTGRSNELVRTRRRARKVSKMF